MELLEELAMEEENKKTFFTNKEVFSTKYQPKNIIHRDEEFKKVFKTLAPILKGEQPPHIFMYGGTGTGKSLVVDKVLSFLYSKNQENMEYYFFNCMAGTTTLSEYQILQNMLEDMGVRKNQGYSAEVLSKELFEALAKKGDKNIVFVFDELDALLKNRNSEFLYKLLRAEEIYASKAKSSKARETNQIELNCKITIIGISNSSNILSLLDARTKSSLTCSSFIFKPYNAVQLVDILTDRAIEGLEKDTYDEELIPIVGAKTGRDSGDARKGIAYLKSCAEIAYEQGLDIISKDLVDEAIARANLDKLSEIIEIQPPHRKAVLYAALMAMNIVKHNLVSNKKENLVLEEIEASKVFNKYVEICKILGWAPVTDRQVRDHIKEWEILEVLRTKLSYQGRHGRSKIVEFTYSSNIRDRVIDELENLLNLKSD